jgi:hypothetical protein
MQQHGAQAQVLHYLAVHLQVSGINWLFEESLDALNILGATHKPEAHIFALCEYRGRFHGCAFKVELLDDLVELAEDVLREVEWGDGNVIYVCYAVRMVQQNVDDSLFGFLILELIHSRTSSRAA